MIKAIDQKTAFLGNAKLLTLFQEFEAINARQVGELFVFKPRTSAQICKEWVDSGLLEIMDFSNKGREYKLAKQYESLI